MWPALRQSWQVDVLFEMSLKGAEFVEIPEDSRYHFKQVLWVKTDVQLKRFSHEHSF